MEPLWVLVSRTRSLEDRYNSRNSSFKTTLRRNFRLCVFHVSLKSQLNAGLSDSVYTCYNDGL